MCEALTGMLTEARDNAGGASTQKKDAQKPSLLIADKDGEGRPVGIGGRRRERDIMDIVDGAQSGLQIPNK